jgi:hypothetical protein
VKAGGAAELEQDSQAKDMSLRKPSTDIPGAIELNVPTANIPVGLEEEEKTAENPG